MTDPRDTVAPSPQQPTKEALALADELWWILGSRGGDARQGAVRDAAERIDRFAAQRVTAAPSADVLEQARAIAAPLWKWHSATGQEELVRGIAAALTAATDKARREALQDARKAARGEEANRGAANEVAAAYIQGRLDAASDIRDLQRALTQNPGDAAHE